MILDESVVKKLRRGRIWTRTDIRSLCDSHETLRAMLAKLAGSELEIDDGDGEECEWCMGNPDDGCQLCGRFA